MHIWVGVSVREEQWRRVTDKVISIEHEVMKGFYLYITTKMPKPSYTPEVGLMMRS